MKEKYEDLFSSSSFDKAMRKAYGRHIKIADVILENGKKIHGKVLDVLTSNEIISHKFTQSY